MSSLKLEAKVRSGQIANAKILINRFNKSLAEFKTNNGVPKSEKIQELNDIYNKLNTAVGILEKKSKPENKVADKSKDTTIKDIHTIKEGANKAFFELLMLEIDQLNFKSGVQGIGGGELIDDLLNESDRLKEKFKKIQSVVKGDDGKRLSKALKDLSTIVDTLINKKMKSIEKDFKSLQGDIILLESYSKDDYDGSYHATFESLFGIDPNKVTKDLDYDTTSAGKAIVSIGEKLNSVAKRKPDLMGRIIPLVERLRTVNDSLKEKLSLAARHKKSISDYRNVSFFKDEPAGEGHDIVETTSTLLRFERKLPTTITKPPEKKLSATLTQQLSENTLAEPPTVPTKQPPPEQKLRVINLPLKSELFGRNKGKTELGITSTGFSAEMEVLRADFENLKRKINEPDTTEDTDEGQSMRLINGSR